MADQPQESDSHHSNRRNRAIKSAVATSLASKVGTALLQLVSIPIAFRVLEPEPFGLYATVALSIGTIMIFQLGIGPALTHGISRSRAENNPDLEREYFSTAWFMILGMAAIAGLVFTTLLKTVPLTFFFGEKYHGFEEQMMPALWIALGIVVIDFILSHTERAREGHLQVHLNNLWGAAGNVFGALLVGFGIHVFPTIEFLIIAVFGSRVLAKIGNTIHLLLKNTHLLPHLKNFRKKTAILLFTDGLAFTVSYALTGIIQINFCSLIIGRMTGPSAVGTFMILSQISTFMLGFIIMFTTPIWPGVVDSFTRRDFVWVRKTIHRLWMLVLSYTAAGVIGLTLLGPTLIPIWMGPEIEITWLVLLPFSLYFLTHAWSHVNQTMLIGVGMVRSVAIFSLIETLLLLIPVYILTKPYALSGMFSGMFFTMLAMTAWIFPMLLLRKLKQSEADPSEASVEDPSLTSPSV